MQYRKKKTTRPFLNFIIILLIFPYLGGSIKKTMYLSWKRQGFRDFYWNSKTKN